MPTLAPKPPRRWPAVAVVAATLCAGSILLAAAATTAPAEGRSGIVTTTAGQTFEGEITETDDKVTIVRGGFRASVARDDVGSIEYSTYAERFAQRLAALDPADIEGRVKLSQEASGKREFDLAQQALDQALEIDPLSREARRASIALAAQLQMEARRSAREPATGRPGAAAGPRAPRRLKGLDDEQANLVRQAELRRGDRVRIRFADNVRKRYVDEQPDLSFRQFNTLPDTEQALEILAKGTREMADDVVILSDPAAIATFARRIQPALVQGCATSYCHGGNQAGSFKLLAGVPDASTAITNFYLVTTWAKELPPAPGAVFSGGTLEMVSRGRAADSVLYQYALPRARAKYKHPPVRGWDGLFQDADDRLAVELSDWIDRQLVPMRPSYGFTYTPFPADATSEPTTAPAE